MVAFVSELLRARLDGLVSIVDFFAGGPALAESSPSSPDASREEGWRSAPGIGRWEALRLRLVGGEEGDDIVILGGEGRGGERMKMRKMG